MFEARSLEEGDCERSPRRPLAAKLSVGGQNFGQNFVSLVPIIRQYCFRSVVRVLAMSLLLSVPHVYDGIANDVMTDSSHCFANCECVNHHVEILYRFSEEPGVISWQDVVIL